MSSVSQHEIKVGTGARMNGCEYGTSKLVPYLSEYQPLRVTFFPQNGQLCG
jgi:hypothetical protein